MYELAIVPQRLFGWYPVPSELFLQDQHPQVINYRNTGGKWPGFARSNHFAVRWTGRLRIRKKGQYRFGIISDDGSKLWVDNRYTINNDGLHGWRNKEAAKHLRAGWHLVRLEMFERGGAAGMLFRYRGPDTANRWATVRASGRRQVATRPTYRAGLFRENVYYFGQGGRCQNLNSRKANMARWRHVRGRQTNCRATSNIQHEAYMVHFEIHVPNLFRTPSRGGELSQHWWQMERLWAK